MAYTRRSAGSKSSAPRRGGGGGGSNDALIYGGLGLGLVALLLLGGDSTGGTIKQFQQQQLDGRLSQLMESSAADRAQKAAAESAQRAKELWGDGSKCIRIVNVGENAAGLPEGSVHIALSPGMKVIDPVTRAPMPPNSCVADHLGHVALTGEGGTLNQIFYSGDLVEHKLWTNTTQQVGQ